MIHSIDSIANEIIHLIHNTVSENVQIELDTNLTSVGVNSIIFIKLAVAIEEKYDFEIQNEYMMPGYFKTIRQLAEYICQAITE